MWSMMMAIASSAVVLSVGCAELSKEKESEGTRRVGSMLEAASDSGEASAVERGRYLVSHVALCGDCHSPRAEDGSFDPERWLSGVECFVDVVPEDPEQGCLHTRNLTNHETGLANRSDREIEDMFMKGVRPDGKALHPFMPYAFFANMRESDARAIVAYLRQVDGVEHQVPPSEPPFTPPSAPAPPVPEAAIPAPRADYPDQAAALRGRYLAGNIGGCMDCHTPRGEAGILLDRAFQGGMRFARDMLGLPASYPETIYSANLTPHATGIAAYSVADVARALKHGIDPNQGTALCPPMPAGPLGPLGGLSDADAADIAHYLRSLPPADNAIPVDCSVADPAQPQHGKE